MPMPRMTIGRMMLGVALIGVCTPVFLAIMWGLDPAGVFTVYAPGYSEAKFSSLTTGMSPAAVEAVMGKPLFRVAWSGGSSGDSEMWYYSNHQAVTANFWRRWVAFDRGKWV